MMKTTTVFSIGAALFALTACGGASVDSRLTETCRSAIDVLKIDEKATANIPTDEVMATCTCAVGKLSDMSEDNKTELSTNLAKITVATVNNNPDAAAIMSPEALALLPQFSSALVACDERFT